MTLPTVSCPACGRSFKNEHGRGGHLTTVSDPAHEAYRAAHGLPAKTPRATQVANRGRPSASAVQPPSGHDAPAKRASRSPSPQVHVARVAIPGPPNPAQSSTLLASSPAALPGAQGPATSSTDGAASPMKQAVEDFMRQVEENRLVKPKARAAKKRAKPGEPSGMNDAQGALVGAGMVAAGLGLYHLVKSRKGANAPTQMQAVGATRDVEPALPATALPGISGLRPAAPMMGAIRVRHKPEWWHL